MWLFIYLSMKLYFWSFSLFEDIWMFLKLQVFQIWDRLWKNSQKTLGRLLGKSSNAFCARRIPTKSSGNLLKSFAQSDTNFGYVFCEFYILDSKKLYIQPNVTVLFIIEHKQYFWIFFCFETIWMFWMCKLFRSESDFGRLLRRLSKYSRKTLKRLLEDFLGSLLLHFMLEDVPWSLQEVFLCFMPKVVQNLDMYFVCFIY